MNTTCLGQMPVAHARRHDPRNRKARGSLLLCAGLVLGARALAADVSLHGFGTIGAAFVDKPDDWAYTRSLNQRTSDDGFRPDLDSVLGLQVNYRPSATVELVGQASASLLNDAAKPVDYLDLAFVAWRPDPAWTLRLGRVNLDAYLISDYRDVGFSYLPIRPPVEFYSRMPTSLDGADVVRTWVRGDVQWSAKAFVGQTSAGVGTGRLKVWPLYGVMLSREANGLQVRISGLQGRPSDSLASLDPLLGGLQQVQMLPVPQVAAEAAQMQQALTTRNVRTDYLAAAIAYDRNDWLLAAEINSAKVKDRSNISFYSGYVSVGRRLGPVSAFVMESVAARRGDPAVTPDWVTPLTPIDPMLAQQAQAVATGATIAINRTAADQSTTALGLRWDVAPRIALKAQWDHVRTRREGSGLWHAADDAARSSDVLAVTLDFVF